MMRLWGNWYLSSKKGYRNLISTQKILIRRWDFSLKEYMSIGNWQCSLHLWPGFLTRKKRTSIHFWAWATPWHEFCSYIYKLICEERVKYQYQRSLTSITGLGPYALQTLSQTSSLSKKVCLKESIFWDGTVIPRGAIVGTTTSILVWMARYTQIPITLVLSAFQRYKKRREKIPLINLW